MIIELSLNNKMYKGQEMWQIETHRHTHTQTHTQMHTHTDTHTHTYTGVLSTKA